jgi:hypothetical protein
MENYNFDSVAKKMAMLEKDKVTKGKKDDRAKFQRESRTSPKEIGKDCYGFFLRFYSILCMVPKNINEIQVWIVRRLLDICQIFLLVIILREKGTAL